MRGTHFEIKPYESMEDQREEEFAEHERRSETSMEDDRIMAKFKEGSAS